MARTLKGTRARGLPAKLLLSQRQDATGSFPTVWRTSSDNRTGKYPVFFNDNKVINFNQPVTDAGIFVTTYPHYEEKVVTVGSPGNPVNDVSIVFDNPFTGLPTIVLTELTNNSQTPNVNAFVKDQSTTGSYVNFSAPFEGTLVYRAIYQPTPGTPVNVIRSPRYPSQYSLVVNQDGQLKNSNNVHITYSDFGSVPTDNYVTFYDSSNNNQANLSSSITFISNTSIQVTGSSTVNGIVTTYYMGFGETTATAEVKGIVYPLVMTPQAINAGLSEEAKTDLYKQPYFSSSVVVNQPIVASGSMVKGVSDLFVTFTPGQDVEPFMDFANPEVDGKALPVTSSTYQFYATGSAVTTTGLGFQQPVWSKNKIEIDITPATTQSFTLFKSASVGSYPMGYWNPNTKLYEGIGTGKGIDSYSGDLNGLKQALEEQTFGYTFSTDNGGTLSGVPQIYNLYGRQTSTYGFPYHPKFQPTSLQQILVSDYISEPFILEKIVLEISGASAFSSYASNTAIWTFFLLNSRQVISQSLSKQQNINYTLGGVSSYSTFTTSSILSDRILDVVDTIQIAISASNDTSGYLANREQLIETWAGISTSKTGSFQFLAKSTVKSQIAYNSNVTQIFSGSSAERYQIECTLNSSGRSQYYDISGRDWVNSFENPVIISTGSFSLGAGSPVKVNINDKYTKPNPYILLPTDKLTFGFQLPYNILNQIGSNTFMFSTQGINKIILYGSTLRLNPETNQLEEHHDTLNQLLCSNSVHEVIGE